MEPLKYEILHTYTGTQMYLFYYAVGQEASIEGSLLLLLKL